VQEAFNSWSASCYRHLPLYGQFVSKLVRSYWWVAPSVILALVLVWAVLWPLTDALAAHDISSISGPARAGHIQSAREAARTQLLTLGAGIFAAGALFYTGRNFTLSRQQMDQARRQFTEQMELSRKSAQDSAEAERRTLELTESGQVTDRYTKAIEQLGSNKLDVRIGGIYGLERIASDSARDHPTVMEVLAAFVREHSREDWLEADRGTDPPSRATRPDVQAAVTVIGRRNADNDRQAPDLTGANLTRADLAGANLQAAKLTAANLTGANLASAVLNLAFLDNAIFADADLPYAKLRFAILPSANFSGANLEHADLWTAFLPDAILTGAYMVFADVRGEVNLRNANLAHAVLDGAQLQGVGLEHAILTSAALRGADLSSAHLGGANLAGVQLSGARLTGADLTGADLTKANFDVFIGSVPLRSTLGITVTSPLLQNLPVADLAGALLAGADLTGARWPDGKPAPEGWVRDSASGELLRDLPLAGTGTE
jgi:uncharacterized protein YjbI with pentapeptide repeats